MLVMMYLLYYGLPALGLTLDAFTASVIALGVSASAYIGEGFRAALISTPKLPDRSITGLRHGQDADILADRPPSGACYCPTDHYERVRRYRQMVFSGVRRRGRRTDPSHMDNRWPNVYRLRRTLCVRDNLLLRCDLATRHYVAPSRAPLDPASPNFGSRGPIGWTSVWFSSPCRRCSSRLGHRSRWPCLGWPGRSQ